MQGKPVGGLPRTCTGSSACSSSGNILLLLTLLAAGVGQQLGGPYHGRDWVATPAGQGGPTQQIQLQEVCQEASSWRHPLRGGGIARREQALSVWICARLRALSSCKGAQKALMYLLAP